MPFNPEYHVSVRHSIPASVAAFGLLMLPAALVSLVLVSSLSAQTFSVQTNGVPTSVTSPGFGGRPINGTPPSVTSVGPARFGSASGVPFTGPALHGPADHDPAHRDGSQHRRHHYVQYNAPVMYPLAVPYAVDISDTDDYAGNDADTNAENDAEYQGGPTVFDRRGSGAGSYVPPVSTVPRPHAKPVADADPADPEPAPQPTLLVFKDGRQLEVANYAIVGANLFDLTPGHRRLVALADLDLDATRKHNDDRGVIFQLPLQAN